MPDEAPLVLVERPGDGWVRLRLNDPARMNAISRPMLARLEAALDDALADPAVKAIVIAGAGPCFSAGNDLSRLASAPRGEPRRDPQTGSVDDDAWYLEGTQRTRMRLFHCDKVTIAQVHGYCLAGANDMALLCDFIVCADDARFAFPPARNLGSLPNHLWLHNVGPQWAKRLLLTGDTILGVDAARIRMALRSVPPDSLETYVDGLCAGIATLGLDEVRACKRTVNVGLELMGVLPLQRLAAENDVRGHQAPAAFAFRDEVKALGLKTALRNRDAPFKPDVVAVKSGLQDPNGVGSPGEGDSGAAL